MRPWVSRVIGTVIVAVLVGAGAGGVIIADNGPSVTPTPTATPTGTPGPCTGAAVTTGTFAARVTAAAPGDVLCLNTGSYGTWTGTSKAVTVTAAAGQSPTMQIDFSSGGGFTLDGLGGMKGDISGSAQNITIRNSTFIAPDLNNDAASLHIDGSATLTGIVIDHDDFSFPVTTVNENGPNAKLRIDSATGTLARPAVLIKNSDFSNGDLDGVHIGGDGGSTGVVVLNNTFRNICEAGVNHTDDLQFDSVSPGYTQTRIAGNLFYAGVGCGITMLDSFDSGTCNVTVEDNVLEENAPDGHGNAIEWDGDGNCTGLTGVTQGSDIRHNTLVYHSGCFADGGNGCGQVSMGDDHGTRQGAGTRVYDNVAANIQFLSGGATGTMHHNLCHASGQGCTGTGNLTGSPTFAGGAAPSTFLGYLLTAGSLGHLGASDGLDVGITGVAS